MTEADLDQTFAKLTDAIARDDEKAGRDALLALVRVSIGAVLRIADSLEHLGRNMPTPSEFHLTPDHVVTKAGETMMIEPRDIFLARSKGDVA